jgi:geranylgeranyl diphosphate synthase, type I
MENPKAEKALKYLAERRGAVEAALRLSASERGASLEAGFPGGADLAERILEFCLRGKMIRGCLTFLGAEAAAREDGDVDGVGGASGRAAVPMIAAAMELFQAGLLAHDDIMDRDETRRGEPTVHRRYAAEARSEGLVDPDHAGEAMAICLGDACYFEGFALVARALAGRPVSARVSALCAEVLSEVATAQMADVRWGSAAAEVGEDEILAMYRCKTARYSFSLPLAAGALIAGDEASADALSAIGESLGVAFQLRDDELNLFGDPELTGKRPGGDLREGKKTLLRAGLLSAASPSELPRLRSILGDAQASDADIDYVRRLAESLGVRLALSRKSAELAERARAGIAGLRRPDAAARGILEGLVEYVTLRDK